MPLESLQDPNIRRMSRETPEQTKEKTPRELLEDLKETEFYDEESGMWNTSINKRGELEPYYTSFNAKFQLIGVIAEYFAGNKEAASALLLKLKNTKLFDSKTNQWNLSIERKGKPGSVSRYSDVQLFGIIAEYLAGDSASIKRQYEKLKKTEIYDSSDNQWMAFMAPNGKLHNSEVSPGAQLLGIIVECLIENKTPAQHELSQLKETVFYYLSMNQWRGRIDSYDELYNTDVSSELQLISVLAEYFSGDKDLAQLHLSELKETELYDHEKNQWNDSMSEKKKVVDYGRPAGAQLLGIIAEALCQESKEEDIIPDKKPLPETLKY